jgi:hypothetical protein
MRAQLELPRDLGTDVAQRLSRSAFQDGDPQSLEEAHRALYAIYADRIWRPTPTGQTAEILRFRNILEAGFRGQLDRVRESAGIDLTPPPADHGAWFESLALGPHPLEDGSWGAYLKEEATRDALERIVAQRSLFFLREPDPWIYAVPTIAGVAKAGLIDLLLDEYGWGKLDRMHSSIYANLMDALGLETAIDHYELTTTWQFLATQNHQWMCALDPLLSRRLIGTIYLTEADSPQAMTNYLAAWDRLGIDDPRVIEFYELHVAADENHRDVALSEVAVPIAEAEGEDAARSIATGIFDARTLEAEFARSELSHAVDAQLGVA